MKYPVCGEALNDTITKCSECGFDELHKIFLNEADAILWFNEKVSPHRINYILSKMMPREAEIVRFRLGLTDGIQHSAEEIAVKYDVCVNRFVQVEAKFFRQSRKCKKHRDLELL